MEVHAHSHTARKKWTHYFWEFLMLFLAVFCGFLAENQREHMVEHQREKQFMLSLTEDLKTDILQLEKYKKWRKETNADFDSLIILLSTENPESNAYDIYKIANRSFLRTGLPDISERTIQQLKNSGGLRLIRKEEVSGQINKHYLEVNRMKSNYESEIIARAKLLEVRGEVLYASQLFRIKDTTMHAGSFKLISKDPLMINRLTNSILAAVQTNLRIINSIDVIIVSSLSLKEVIEKEYHLK